MSIRGISTNSRHSIRAALWSAAFLTFHFAAAAQTATVELDAREAPRRVLHAHLVLPAQPGPLTLLYPKWIPGEHGPFGPLNGLVGLRFSSQGQRLPWQRDPLDMYSFRLEVPADATAVEADLEFLVAANEGGFSMDPSTTEKLAVLNWNDVVLYPQGRAADQLTYQASVRLPAGWSFATSLPVAAAAGEPVRFAPVSLTTLIDSPVLIGVHLLKVPLRSGEGPGHEIDIAADDPAALELPTGFAESYARLTEEAGALFGARPYRHYQWLLALSDHLGHAGLEHHESSDNRVPEATLGSEATQRSLAFLLAHEYVHSWNGKYRRPAGLTTPDYQQPMRGDLLWVYEGLTQYLSFLLPVRSGLWTPEYFREKLAEETAFLDHTPGREWRSLGDTAVAAQTLYTSSLEWIAWRRGADFYNESILVWLEADASIRQQTHGRQSLDDFCRRFHGGPGGEPTVKPYILDEVVGTLGEVAPSNWRGFLRHRIDEIEPRAPVGGIEASGWRLVYNETPNQALIDFEERTKFADASFSLGLTAAADGTVADVIPGLPAARAGLSPGMKLLAVNGRKWNPGVLKTALKAAKTTAEPIELLAENGEYIRSYRADYHGGERYPHLERITERPDLLAEILRPRVAARK